MGDPTKKTSLISVFLLLGLLVCAAIVLPQNGFARTLRIPAQQPTVRARTGPSLKDLHVDGTTRFTPQQILRASGLQIGEELTDARLREAQQRLADTGVFTEIGAQEIPGTGGDTVTFTLKDMLPIIPCDFSQIQGVDPQHLSAEISSELPLFDGHVPVANPVMLTQVREHLQQILERHGIHGRVEGFAHIADLSAGTSAKSHNVASVVFRLVNEPEK